MLRLCRFRGWVRTSLQISRMDRKAYVIGHICNPCGLKERWKAEAGDTDKRIPEMARAS